MNEHDRWCKATFRLGYVMGLAQRLLANPETREQIEHGMRQVAGDLARGEVRRFDLPDSILPAIWRTELHSVTREEVIAR